MKILQLLLLFISVNGFFLPKPLRVFHTVKDRKWISCITNTGEKPITTRIKGEVWITNKEGERLRTFRIPLGGIHLQPNESCMTEVSEPLPDYHETVIVSCTYLFADILQYFDSHIEWKNLKL